MAKYTKNFLEKKSKIEDKEYSLSDAIKILKEIKTNKFDESVELSFRLGVDPKYPEQMVRGTVVLPHGTGKSTKVLAIVNESNQEIAKEAGADFVGSDDLIAKIQKEKWFGFDVLVTTPDMMRFIGKLGKVLGPKGLMPSPKAGTVTKDVKNCIEEIKKGRIEFKVDKTGIINSGIGKMSFTEEKILENAKHFGAAISKAKPISLKGTYIKSFHICSTMSPSVKINTNDIDE